MPMMDRWVFISEHKARDVSVNNALQQIFHFVCTLPEIILHSLAALKATQIELVTSYYYVR